MDRFLNSPLNRESQLAKGWDEELCTHHCEVALEDQQTIEIPVVSYDEKIIEVFVARTPEKASQVANTLVQHDVNTVEVEKVQSRQTVHEKINQVTKAR